MQRSNLMELSIKFNNKISGMFGYRGRKDQSEEAEIGTPEYWLESARRLLPLTSIAYIVFLISMLAIMFLSLPLFLVALIAIPAAFVNLVFRRYISYSKMNSNYIEPTQRDMVYGIILTSLIAIIAWLFSSMMLNRLF